MRRLILLLGLLLAALPATASAATIGIADQKADLFSDPRFLDLGITQTRIGVSWDVLSDGVQLAKLDRYMLGARVAGVQPLVTFDRSRRTGRTRLLPSTTQMASALRGLRKRYAFVGLRTFSTWNEANFGGQRTYRRPDLVARWWRALRIACPSCTVLGADLLDTPNVGTWAKAFVHAAGRQPAVWGLHDYIGANRRDPSGTRRLLAAVRGRIWLTETGGLVARRNRSTIRLPEGVTNAANVTRYILRTLTALSPRIQRVYLYQWNVSSRFASWDSAFIGPRDTVRPALAVLRAALAAQRRRTAP